MFRLVTFNILNGAHTPTDRLAKIAGLLEGLRPDLVFLQECVDWTEPQLQYLGEQIELPHSYLTHCNPRGSGVRYNLGALSRRPFRLTRSHVPELLAHGCQEVGVAEFEFSFFNLHLIARAEDDRMAELEWFKERRFQGVLAGDLNSLNPHDPYPDNFADRLRQGGVSKYGQPPRFEVMRELSESGWSAPRPERSWVTRWRTEASPPIPTRTDYILGKGSARDLLERVWVVDLKESESDHNPVVGDFRPHTRAY